MKTEIDNTQIGSIYESNEEIPCFPPRTKLYSLKPCGLGTPWVESLSGYLARLSVEHHMTLGDLFGRVLSEIENPYGNILSPANQQRAASTTHHGFTQRTYGMNGVDSTGEQIVFALESSTGLRGLRALTFLAYQPVLGGITFHRQRTWCPACLEEWRTAHLAIYEPLFWTCATTKMCPKHNLVLVSQCPECGLKAGLVTVGLRIGYCDHCGAWLGRFDSAGGYDLMADTEAIWKQSQIIGLIGMLHQVQPQASQLAWRRNLHRLVRALTNGSLHAFGKHVGITSPTIKNWLNGRAIPWLGNALRVAHALGVDVCCLFDESPLSEAHLSVARQAIVSTARPTRVIGQKTRQIQIELERSLGNPVPESVTAIAYRLGLKSTASLYRADPITSHAVGERYRRSKGKMSGKFFDKLRAQQLLLNEIGSEEPRSTLQVAAEMGFSPDTLEYHYPKLCCQLKRRRKEANLRTRAEAIKELHRALGKL